MLKNEKTNNNFRILAASDIHANEPVINNLAKIAEKEKVDLVVLAGDLLEWNEYARNIIKPFLDKNKPVVFVPGNHETSEAAESIAKHYKVKNLDGDCLKMGDIGFFGAGGTNMMLNYVPDSEIYENLKKGHERIRDAKKKIMVTHMPPAGTLFEKFFVRGAGSKAVTKAIEKFQPDIHICGHIHEMEGFEEKIGKTRVITVGARGTIIDV